jgi:hypothetical protein
MTDHAILALLLGAYQGEAKSSNQWLDTSAKYLIRRKIRFDAAMTPL